MDQNFGSLMPRVTLALRLAMEAELRPLRITKAQYVVLIAVEQMPSASNAALARACYVTPQTMIEIIQSLQLSGCITRRADPKHGRIIQTILTSSGREKLAAARKVAEKIEGQMLAGLNAEERQKLASLLQRCNDNLEAR